MEDTLVSLETAKILKEKGFEEPVYWHYHFIKDDWKLEGNSFTVRESDVVMFPDKGEHGITVTMGGDRLYRNYTWKDGKYLKASECPYIAAPTLSIAQKWLREVHNIHIVIVPFAEDSTDEFSTTKYHFSVNSKHFYGFVMEEGVGYDTYEQCLEQGIIEALDLIK